MPWDYLDDGTIAAISTPVGEGGIGIVRISGPDAVAILSRVFRDRRGRSRESFDTHRMYYGTVVAGDGELIDEVLVVAMLSPHSYTGEDLAEIHCHGGSMVLRSVLKLVLEQGARPAGPGEFTRRAFLNGRLDLAQAESVIDVIRSRTEQSLKLALGGLSGRLSARISRLRDGLIGVLAHIEAGIDFPEDDISDVETESLRRTLEATRAEVGAMIDESHRGRAYREGVSVAIAGRPNVGKSSVFNAMVREHRAIVTDVPGTTRDVIDEYVNISGIPVRLMDTAGIHETEDVVEREGVSRSRRVLTEADVVLYVVDASRADSGGDLAEDMAMLSTMPKHSTILVINKVDLVDGEADLERYGPVAPETVVATSAASGEGLGELESAIVKVVTKGHMSPGEAIVTNVRHQDALRRCEAHLGDALSAVEQGVPLDLVVIDVREALDALGEITGDTVDEDILDRIFSDFCVGK
jgi:tRNA modification GTPase